MHTLKVYLTTENRLSSNRGTLTRVRDISPQILPAAKTMSHASLGKNFNILQYYKVLWFINTGTKTFNIK